MIETNLKFKLIKLKLLNFTPKHEIYKTPILTNFTFDYYLNLNLPNFIEAKHLLTSINISIYELMY